MADQSDDSKLAAQMQEYMEKLHGIVLQHGWAVQTVMYENPLQYTVGLTARFDHPEVVVCGLPMEVGQSILNDLGRRVKAGENLKAGVLYDNIFRGFPAKFVAISEAAATAELKVARGYGREGKVDALQLLWPSQSGRFPDDPEASVSLRVSQMWERFSRPS